MTQMFFVEAFESNGDDLSWFIEATSAEEALAMYRHHMLDEWGMSAAELTIKRVRSLPPMTGSPRLFQWEEVPVELTIAGPGVAFPAASGEPDDAADREQAEAEARLDDLETAYLNGEISKAQWQNGGA